MNNQLEKQQKSLLSFVKTAEEESIVIARIKSSLISSLDMQNIDDRTTLISAVARWHSYIAGIPKDSDMETLKMNAEYIYNNFGHLTLSELELAYTLSTIGKLQEVKFWGAITPLYIGQILSSYIYYRKMNLSNATRAFERYQQEQLILANKPTPKQQAEQTKEIISDFYKQVIETGEITDPFTIAYDFLRKNKNSKGEPLERFLKITAKDIEEATIYGKNKVKEIKKGNLGLFGKMEISEELEEKRYSRNYLVQKYFKTVDIVLLINKINADYFI